jgi:hypothetical protein
MLFLQRCYGKYKGTQCHGVQETKAPGPTWRIKRDARLVKRSRRYKTTTKNMRKTNIVDESSSCSQSCISKSSCNTGSCVFSLHGFFFFWEQAGELLVIVLSVWEKHDPVYEENRTQKPYKWSRTAFNAHQSTQQAHALPNHRPRRHTIGTQGTKTASQLKQQLEANPNSRRHASTYSPPRGRRVSCRTRPDLEEALSKRCRRQCTLRPRRPHSK